MATTPRYPSPTTRRAPSPTAIRCTCSRPSPAVDRSGGIACTLPRMDKRHLASAAVLAGFLGLNTATDKPKSDTSGTTPATSTPTTAAPATKTPVDLDVAAAIKDLGCAGKKTDGCRVLSDFESASAAPDLPDTGRTFWFGQTFGIGDAGDGKKDFYFLTMSSGAAVPPAGMSDKDTLNATGGAQTLKPDDEYERQDAVSFLAALKAGKKPTISSAELYITTFRRPKGEAPFVKTSGASTGIFYPDAPLYSFMRKKGDHVVLVEYRGGTAFGDKIVAKAWVSELWLIPPRT